MMHNPYESNPEDLDELLRQVDDLLTAPEPEPEGDDIDLSDYAPQGLGDDEPILYQNYSNRYGADVRNYSNGYGAGQPVQPPTPQAQPQPVIPAYNADFHREQRREERREERRPEYREIPPAQPVPPAPQPPAQPRPKQRRPKKRMGCCGCGCLGMVVTLVVLVVALVVAVNRMFQPPQASDSIGRRKDDTAAILLCGTDADGTRTDTMMLVYVSGSEKRTGLLSLPRDTYTITSRGYGAKLNSAYGRNGTGEEGMEGLLDYVQDIIGYRPDGYILVDMTLVPQIVDLMGGVEVDVPTDFTQSGISFEEGMQHLDGEELLQLLRHRKSYATADLGRIQVQRDVIKACMEQWLTTDHLGNLKEALELVENGSISSLDTPNYLWMAKSLIASMGNFSNDTLPGYADYIDGVSYYLADPEETADLINEFYNPYQVTIDASDLNIAG